MSTSPTSAQFFIQHYRRFASTISGVRLGSPEAVHDARVAVRRMRAALPLLSAPSAKTSVEGWAPALRDIGRALGGVRDLDVSIELLREFERRVPPVASLVVSMRQSLAAQQGCARRKMIKQLESSSVETLLRDLAGFANSGARGRSPLRAFTLARRRPTARIRRHVAERARSLTHAVEHAGGVYFPRRVHRARVDAKKFRYAMEIAEATGAMHAEAPLNTLRRAQEVLGRVHDCQVLIDLLDQQLAAVGAVESQRELFARILEAERDELHQKYVARLPELLSVCTAAQRFGGQAPRLVVARESWMALGAVAVPAGLWLLTRRRPADVASATAPVAARAPEPKAGPGRGQEQDPPEAPASVDDEERGWAPSLKRPAGVGARR